MPETRIAFTVSYVSDDVRILSEEALHRCETEVNIQNIYTVYIQFIYTSSCAFTLHVDKKMRFIKF